VDETARTLERGFRAGEAPLGEEGGDEAALRGAPGVEALAHAAEHLADPGRLRRGGAERPRGAQLVEPEEARARGGRADDAGGAGDVPADRVMGRQNRTRHAAFGFDARDERIDELGAGGTAQLGERQKRGGDRPAGMHEDLRVGVVEVEHV